MSPRAVRALRVLFCAYVVITCLHIAYVAHHKPYSFDAWNDTGAEPFESSLWITTTGLERLEVVQYSPRTQARRVEHRLLDAEPARPSRRNVDLAARRAARSELPVRGMPVEFLFATNRLPSENSRPMLRRLYAGNLATMGNA